MRTAFAREKQTELDAIKLGLEVEDRELRRGATNALAAAFEGVLDRSVPRIETSWVVDRLADLGIAAAKQGDLGTVRSVLGDFMKHAQAIEEVSPGDVEVLAGALAQLGPAAVANAARRLGLELVRSGPQIEEVPNEVIEALRDELDEPTHTGGLAHTPSPTHAAIHALTPMQQALAERLKLKER